MSTTTSWDDSQEGPGAPGGVPYSSAIQGGRIIPAAAPPLPSAPSDAPAAAPSQGSDPDWMDKLAGFKGNTIDHPAAAPSAPGEWQSSSGVMPAGTGGSPAIPSPGQPPQQAPAPPPPPVTPDHPVVKQLAAIGENELTVKGAIDFEAMKNHTAQLALDDANKARLLANIDMAQKHVAEAQRIGRQAAYDQSGRKYWEDESTGGKILRILEGVFTLGGSEAYIGSAIKRQVAADQKNLDSENNTYAAQLELGKSKEQAASNDAVKQGHLFQLGLDRIKMKYPKMSDDQRGTIAALQTGIEKETSLAMLQNIKQAQDNSIAGKHVGIAQQGANTANFNAQTERMKANADIAKLGQKLIVRDANGNPIGPADSEKSKEHLDSLGIAISQMRRAKSQMDLMVLNGSRLSPADTLSMENAKKGFIEGLSADIDSGKIIPSSRTKEMIDRFQNSNFSLWSTQAKEADKILRATADDYAEQKRRAGIKQ